ncbi:MAG TPA: hypothetical protein VLA00_14755 [Xanthobacteraceae bacterium]|nr:hypothetical protein [Xanthobacteraceae bacterium]
MARRISLNQQIEEVQMELDKRRSVYPRLVSSKKLGASLAQYQMDRMEAVERTLLWLRRHERTFRQRCPEIFGDEAGS